MKLRRGFLFQQLLFLTLGLLGPCIAASAQDQIVTRDGRVSTTEVVGVVGTSVEVKVGAGTIGVPLASIEKVVKAPPAAFKAALRAYKAGDMQKALVGARSTADRFAGLPTPWAQQATGMVGDIYLRLGDEKKAEAAFALFKQKYPRQASLQGDVGMARLAVSKGDWETAKDLVEPIAETALQDRQVSRSDGLAYSQAFLVLGQIKENEKDFPGALQDYLRTVTIFREDSIAVSDAQVKADALRKENNVFVP